MNPFWNGWTFCIEYNVGVNGGGDVILFEIFIPIPFFPSKNVQTQLELFLLFVDLQVENGLSFPFLSCKGLGYFCPFIFLLSLLLYVTFSWKQANENFPLLGTRICPFWMLFLSICALAARELKGKNFESGIDFSYFLNCTKYRHSQTHNLKFVRGNTLINFDLKDNNQRKHLYFGA